MTIALSHQVFAELYEEVNPEESQALPSKPYEFTVDYFASVVNGAIPGVPFTVKGTVSFTF
jgi:hypothetical protein